MKFLCPLVILALFVSANAIGFHGFHFKGMEEPNWIGPRTIKEKWIEQPLDHFNHRDERTWQMRFYEEDRHFNGSGPIFIFLGGEWDITPGYLQSGLMASLAVKHGALMYYTEHRYYGKSKPTKNLSVENMQYLSVDQALADVAYFVKAKKAERDAEDAKVIVFGGSYSGNMAAWIRIKYPHLIQGAVASSAPIYAKADFYEYYEVVTNSLRRYDERCAANVKIAFEEIDELLTSDVGAEKVKKVFNTCEVPNVRNKQDISYFMNFLAEKFAGSVQYNKGGLGHLSTIAGLCTKMVDSRYSTPIQRLASLFKNESCIKVDYLHFLASLKEENFSGGATRQWTFQTCTEYGYFQTTNSSKSGFGSMFNLDFFVDLCVDLYGEYYERGLLDFGVRRTNIQYGGRFPDVTNVIFSNGDVDPWHSLSVLEDLNESSPAILIPTTSHCHDLKADSPSDPPEMTAARKRIREIVSGWLQN